MLVFHHTLNPCNPWCNTHLPVLEGNIAISMPKEKKNTNVLLQRELAYKGAQSTAQSHHALQWNTRDLKFILRLCSYQSRREQVHVPVQGWNGNISTKLYDSNKKKTQPICWIIGIPPGFLPKHQSEVTNAIWAVHELLLWLMWPILCWIPLDSTLKLKSRAPGCDVLWTTARKFGRKPQDVQINMLLHCWGQPAMQSISSHTLQMFT